MCFNIKISVIFLLFTLPIFSQNNEKDDEKNVKPVKNFVNVYYGPSLINSFYKNFAKNALDNNTSIEINSNSFGPVGLVYENRVTDIVGIGCELGYSKFNLTITDYVSNSLGTFVPYEYNFKWTIIRAMLRANFHFSYSNNFDVYGFVSGGLKYSSLKFSTNDPLYNFSKKWASIPIGFKPGIGFRYFFIPNAGLNVELAAGSPIICGGLSFKF